MKREAEKMKKFFLYLLAFLGSISGEAKLCPDLGHFLLFSSSASAQSTPPTCPPPSFGEYLVLVVSETKESQEQIQRTLPPSNKTNLCKYSDKIVTRISGFKSKEDADAWGRYVQEIVGLSAFVVRPAEPPAPVTSPAYKPKLLGAGYAVLVDYFSKPEVAAQVQQLLGGDVGLASYGQRPYILAVYTTEQSEANAKLQQLSDHGFWVMVVDSRRVTLLKPVVSLK